MSTHPFHDVVLLPYQEGVPTKKKVAKMKAWLVSHSDKYRNEYTVLYHGTDPSLPIEREGLKRTTIKRRRSYQSKPGYVYLAATPERAESFGKLGNQGKAQVFAVRVLVRKLKADIDQLNNHRSIGENIGNSLAESIIYGGGARYAQAIPPHHLIPISISPRRASRPHLRPDRPHPRQPALS